MAPLGPPAQATSRHADSGRGAQTEVGIRVGAILRDALTGRPNPDRALLLRSSWSPEIPKMTKESLDSRAAELRTPRPWMNFARGPLQIPEDQM